MISRGPGVEPQGLESPGTPTGWWLGSSIILWMKRTTVGPVPTKDDGVVGMGMPHARINVPSAGV